MISIKKTYTKEHIIKMKKIEHEIFGSELNAFVLQNMNLLISKSNGVDRVKEILLDFDNETREIILNYIYEEAEDQDELEIIKDIIEKLQEWIKLKKRKK